jgi:membrane-bound lytic murein transglycosylase B
MMVSRCLAGLALVLLISGFGQDQARANDAAFRAWINGLWPEARARGISRRVFVKAFRGMSPDRSVVELAARQPEFVRPVGAYLRSALASRRIEQGRAKLKSNAALLGRIERRFGVDRYVLTAIWGMESAYGKNKGSRSVIRSLATLGFDGERRKFGRSQLLAALKILQRGDISGAAMRGSWAGAMGHTQFIPTTYNGFAVDFTGDGKRDIWNSAADALASAANYLKASKWQTGAPWGFEVRLPKTFDFSQAGLHHNKPVAEWVSLGVKRADGRKFSKWARPGAVILPAGARGPAFLVFRNFRAVLRYNASVSYALAIHILAARFRGTRRGRVRAAWPKNERPLTRQQRRELQSRLAGKGYGIGQPDGWIGPRTIRAIRSYQKRIGMLADGHPGWLLLQKLRAGG